MHRAGITSPTLPVGKQSIYPTILQRQIEEIEKAAYLMLATTREKWPRFIKYDDGRRIARQSLNRIAALHAAGQRGDTAQVAYEALVLGRFFQWWKDHVPSGS